MELRDVLKCSIKVILLCQILSLFPHSTSGQLDLPSMPGPPYPDPRGQNRWGVKFDPRKHGPPYDKREGSSHRNVYHRPPRRPFHPMLRERDRERDSFWSPARLRSHRLKRPRSQRQNRFYGNNKRRRPRNHTRPYKQRGRNHERDHERDRDREPQYPRKPEEQQFWNTWNAWYKKQKDHSGSKGQMKGVKQHVKEVETSTPITFYVDVDDLKDAQGNNDDDNDHRQKPNSGRGGRWKNTKNYYLNMMKDVYRRAKTYVPTFKDSESDTNTNMNQESGKSGNQWRIFTTIGKGMDAANDAMGSVRKTVGGSVLATGMKYGGKMMVDSLMNVGTSAITKAIKTATFL